MVAYVIMSYGIIKFIMDENGQSGHNQTKAVTKETVGHYFVFLYIPVGQNMSFSFLHWHFYSNDQIEYLRGILKTFGPPQGSAM